MIKLDDKSYFILDTKSIAISAASGAIGVGAVNNVRRAAQDLYNKEGKVAVCWV